jgi:hypothetical protein
LRDAGAAEAKVEERRIVREVVREAPVREEWGGVSEGLQAGLRAQKTDVPLHGSVELTLLVKNVSGGEVQIPVGGAVGDWQLRATQAGKSLDWQPLDSARNVPLSLKPGAVAELKLSVGGNTGKWQDSTGGVQIELQPGAYECVAALPLKPGDDAARGLRTNTLRIHVGAPAGGGGSVVVATKRGTGVVPDQADAFRRAREHAKGQGMNLGELSLVSETEEAYVFQTGINRKDSSVTTFTVSKTTGEVTSKREAAAGGAKPKGGKGK